MPAPPSLLDQPLRQMAANLPEHLAVVDGELTISYGQLDTQVDLTAAALAGLGLGRGDVVSWQLPNWHEAIVLHLATIRIGAISNPIVPIYRRREVEFILARSGARAFFSPPVFRGFDHGAMVAEMRPRLPRLEHQVTVRGEPAPGALAFDGFLAAAGDAPRVERAADDRAVLIYTSGTTADPKGVLHTHATLDYENRSMIEFFGLDERHPVFMPSPLSHITGLLYGMQLPAMLGTHVVLQDIWDPGPALALIERWRCGFMLAATPFLHGLVHHQDLPRRDVGALSVFACGGADVPPELIRVAGERLDCMVTRVYGSTEFPTATSATAVDPSAKRAETDGRPMGECRVRITDEDGRPLAVGEVGEVRLRGPELFVGYLDGGGIPAFDAEGWFATGDLGSLDADSYLTIQGRQKDIILRGGENIGVKEVEDLLFVHPAVAEAAIVAMPDPVLTERACAYVVPAPGAAPTLAELVAYLRTQGLATQKLPEHLELIDEIPKNPAGKVQKFKLRERIRTQLESGGV
jgi:cyclohexanecarboxylate-CoA ligase